MSKYFHNNTKLLILSGVLAGALVFSPALSVRVLAEGTEVTEATTTTTTTEASEVAATTEAATTSTSTEATTTTNASASTTSTDDNGATIVRFYDPEVGWNVRINLTVVAYGTQYNGNHYIPATISDDHKSFTFDGNIQREGYTLVGYSSEMLLSDQRDNATADQSMPYTVDANGFVHVNFADITAWSITDDLRDDTTTYYYVFAPLWAPNPEPEPTPEPEPQPEPEPTPVVPTSDATQTPAPRREKSVLPNTGDTSSVAGIVAALGVALTASGLRKKMK